MPLNRGRARCFVVKRIRAMKQRGFMPTKVEVLPMRWFAFGKECLKKNVISALIKERIRRRSTLGPPIFLISLINFNFNEK